MKYIFFLLPYLFAQPVHAHAEWFVEETTTSLSTPFTFSDTALLLWVGILCLFLCVGYYLHTRVHIESRLPKWMNWDSTQREKIVHIALSFFGLWLVLNSMRGIAIEPTHSAQWLLYPQTAIGLLMIAGVYKRVAAVALVLLWIAGVGMFGFWLFDALYMIGIAALLWSPKDARALHIARITLGIALIITAFREKLLYPELSHAFLQIHDWNFMQNIGLNYSDELFILSAGMMEVIFGLLLVYGWVTRLTIIGLAPILLLTASLLGIVEVIGHIPILVIAVLLLIYGTPKIQKKLSS
ncbi:MAG: DoxX family membrane protein [Candidatus Kerfeldbacteria bacterium]|nr:DoxX family membrane protein [Candidatus Kerfeldbacteria bacterium]